MSEGSDTVKSGRESGWSASRSVQPCDEGNTAITTGKDGEDDRVSTGLQDGGGRKGHEDNPVRSELRSCSVGSGSVREVEDPRRAIR